MLCVEMNRIIISQTIIANINIIDYNWGTFFECRRHNLIENKKNKNLKKFHWNMNNNYQTFFFRIWNMKRIRSVSVNVIGFLNTTL